MTPLDLFTTWYSEELTKSAVKIPSACCLSTIGTDGFPNARFVSLKEIQNGCFIVTGTISSRKGMEIDRCDKVALTFWWTGTHRQVRVQGIATRINNSDADRFFSERGRDSQVVSIVSRQSEETGNLKKLENDYEDLVRTHNGGPLKRPENFGGYAISPLKIELMEFKETRFHVRTLYELSNGIWQSKQLQP